eukprot:INCI17408.1.p1 GENE.INCI17408.1~~INCI17408.1.p1  ORF type:complete len:246 (+),score=54.21 INCI17408.1:274-1011(+)
MEGGGFGFGSGARGGGGGGGGGAARGNSGPQKRGAHFLGDLAGGADKRGLVDAGQPAQPSDLYARPNVKRGSGSLSSPSLGFSNIFKKSRFVPEEAASEVENVKRNANCLSSSTAAGASPFGCVDKRARTNSDYRCRVDPFVQAHIDSFKKAAAQKINELQSQLDTANSQNQTLKAAVPALNRRYEEEHAKAVKLEELLATYTRGVQQLRQRLQAKESECETLKLHLARGTCTSANNALSFNQGF